VPDMDRLEEIVKSHGDARGGLIPLLQDIQKAFGYVPEKAVELVARRLDMFPVEIYGVLTFYAQFRLSPPGRHSVRVCQGTACYIMGGKQLLSHLREKLDIDVNQTTADGRFSLERVACLGCCGMAPVVMIDEDFHSRCTVATLDQVIEDYT
jgi:NADH-quinone oxidoreductase subunit E